uniref:Uncharacterized protein n=1 Tax=Nelumbo nucifera TaxID=4432 RepID=A0A822Z722_NELNU|nr:TPA_asm: hypothetical protein HUJ06_013078 [Nelumbo nucifera]
MPTRFRRGGGKKKSTNTISTTIEPVLVLHVHPATATSSTASSTKASA